MPIYSTQLQDISICFATQRGMKGKCLLRSSILSFLGQRNINFWLAVWILTTTVCELYVLLTVHLLIIFVNSQLDAQFFSMYVYFYSRFAFQNFVLLTVHLVIIFVNSQLDAQFFSLYVYFCSSIQTFIPEGHLHRVTYSRCIDTVNSPDDGHVAVRNM